MLKSTYLKLPPSHLRYKLKFNQTGIYNEFETVFVNALNQHAPIKTKFVRGNSKHHITNSLRKAITNHVSKIWLIKVIVLMIWTDFDVSVALLLNSTRLLNHHRVGQNRFGNSVNICFSAM